MALRVVPPHEQYWSNNQAQTIHDEAVVPRGAASSPVPPDAVVELAPEEESRLCAHTKRFRLGLFLCFAVLVVVGSVVGAVVGTRKRTASSASSGDHPAAKNGTLDTKNPENERFDIGGPCFVGGVLFGCANGLPVVIPDCVVDSYNEYRKNWIPIHDPTFEEEAYDIDSCAPANLGLIVAAAQGTENNVTDVQKYVLATFFMSLNGQAWANNSNWLSSLPLEQWTGLRVDTTSGALEEVWLPNNLLDGTLPPQLGLLSSIKYLHLNNSDITGTIPWQYGALKHLSLPSNRLTGTIPVEWNEDSITLVNLTLRNNFLTGTVPHMSQLEGLVLDRNMMTGTITLGTNLRFLRLDQNRFEGTVQEDLGTSLVGLGLGDNLWDENAFSLESVLTSSPDLKFLVLSNSRLAGTIPTDIGTCRNLTRLDLGHNQLTGSLPTELGLLTSLTLVNVEHNAINGTLPSEFGSLDSLEVLDLLRNDFTGTLPTQLGLLKKLRFLILEGNDLSGAIPSEVCSLWDVGDLDVLGETHCHTSSFGGVSCPSQECCRKCPGVEIVSPQSP